MQTFYEHVSTDTSRLVPEPHLYQSIELVSWPLGTGLGTGDRQGHSTVRPAGTR